MIQNTGADDSTDLMDTLAALAGQGRVPVEDIGGRDDPRLHLRTSEGELHITDRLPGGTREEGSAHERWWRIGKYRVTEESDGHPGMDDDERHAVYVEEVA